MGRAVSDSFINGPVSLADHTSDSGAVWKPHPDYIGTFWVATSSFGVFSNTLDGDEALYYANVLPASADIYIRADILTVGANPPDSFTGLAYRIQLDDESYYRVRHDFTNWVLEKVVNGAVTSLASSATPAWAGADIQIIVMVIGSVHTIWIKNNSTAVSATLTATDSAISANGYVGLWGTCGGTTGGTSPAHTPADGILIRGDTASRLFEAGTNDAAITMPQLSAAWTASIGTAVTTSTGDGSLTMPQMVVGGTITHISALDAALPLIESDITGYVGFSGTLAAALTQIEGSLEGAFPGGAFTLPLFEVDSTVLRGVGVAGDVVMPLLQVAALSLKTGQAIGAFSMPLPDVAAVGLVGSVNTGSVPMPMLLVDAAGFAGKAIAGAFDPPLFDVAGLGYGPYTAALAANLVPLTAYVTAGPGEGAVVTIVAMNLRTGGVTEYTGWTFNSLMTWRGHTFGASASGIFELAGDADDGVAIDSEFRTCNTDFSQIDAKGAFSPFAKRPTDAYLSYQSDEEMLFTVYADDEAFEYTVPKGRYYPRAPSSKVRPHKTELGKGIESNYLQFGVKNRDGGDFLFDSARALVDILKRRV
jgi:hypothetical protein